MIGGRCLIEGRRLAEGALIVPAAQDGSE